MKVALILMLAACASRPRAAEPVARPVSHCLRVELKDDDRIAQVLGCVETAELCERARRKILAAGRLVGVRNVGQCSKEGS